MKVASICAICGDVLEVASTELLESLEALMFYGCVRCMHDGLDVKYITVPEDDENYYCTLSYIRVDANDRLICFQSPLRSVRDA